jgi:His/Glu/Gln/Arg/opine family amino acid ABC transporter permease subunit
MTLKVSLLSMFLAMAIGLPLAFLRMSKHSVPREAAVVYIEVARGIPILVIIFWVYWGFPEIANRLLPMLGIEGFLVSKYMTGFVSGVIALTLKYAGYLAEIFRAGIEAIKMGQTEAAYSLGFSKVQTMRRIVLPQAFRIIIPPTGNAFVGALQDSALVSIIGVNDLMRQAQLAVADIYRPFEVFTAVAVLYLALTITISKINDYIEKKKMVIE